MSKTNKEKLLELKELLDRELEDFGIGYEINQTIEYEIMQNDAYYEDEIHWEVKFKFAGNEVFRYAQFKYEDVLEIEIGEDSWYEVKWWETSVKYLWIAILDYPGDRG